LVANLLVPSYVEEEARNMTDSALAQALGKLGGPPASFDGWERLGFVRNPYPTKSSPIWDVFHNQAAVRDRFYSDLVEFIKPPNPTTTLFFTGGNRVGKTHFMEHHRRVLPGELEAHGIVLPVAVVSAEFAGFERFFFDIVDQLSDSLQSQTGSPLFEEPMEDPSGLAPGDFRRAMERFAQAPGQEKDEVRSLLTGWVRGQRLRQTQRGQLSVFGLVDSPSQVQNTFGGLIAYLKHRSFGNARDGDVRTCPGVLIFVDEFELVWRQRRDRRDQFLQGLRAIIDECAGGGLFLCVGMATGIGPEVTDVGGDYPALFARLKGDRDIPALVEIESAVVGIEYARAFEEFGRAAFSATHQSSRSTVPALPLLADREIDRLFREMVGAALGATVTQADFFDRLHLEADERRKTTARR
jgi:hypothetical protein